MYGMVGCRHIRFGGNRQWGHNQELPQVFWLPHINSETGKANRTDFKFNRCINRIHPNKNPFTNFGEESVDVSTEWHGLPNFSAPLLSEEGKKRKEYTYGTPIHVYAPRMKVIQTWVFRRCTLPEKATDFKFCTHIHRVDWNNTNKRP